MTVAAGADDPGAVVLLVADGAGRSVGQRQVRVAVLMVSAAALLPLLQEAASQPSVCVLA